jgi:sterol desaturase/sphingolipid hydroxylase (fatty acid hydroxylase superfamily)
MTDWQFWHWAFFAQWIGVIKLVGCMALVGWCFEIIKPIGPRFSLSPALFNIGYTLLAFLVGVTLLPWIASFTGPWISGHGGWVRIQFPGGVAGSILAVATFLFIYDFFYYIWHRAQHTLSWLWPVHELHHAERHLSALSTSRHHWLEEPMRLFVVLIPMGLIFQLDPPQIGMIFTLFTFWGYFIHLNCRLELGRFGLIFSGPQYHRIHHSIEEKHYNCNFAAFFPLWDWLFGTLHRPQPGEWPDTGLRERPEGNQWRHALIGPFEAWFGALAKRR